VPQSIVIFGGSGFIGTHLLRQLSHLGATRLISCDIRPPRDPHPNVQYVLADVRDLRHLEIPDDTSLIYNLAAVHTTPGHPAEAYYETNILGALEVTALAERNNVREIVFTSSISVYGPNEAPRSEASPLTPASAYGRSKMMAERIHRAWLERQADRRLVVVRPAVVFGCGEGGNFTRLARLLRRGFFIYPGRLDTIKACIYVDDLLEAIEFARRSNEAYVLLNGCYPDRYTISDIVEAFRGVYFPKVRTFFVPRPLMHVAAMLLQPFSWFEIGIHPERITKLVESTDITPGWLMAHRQAVYGRLPSALARWSAESGGEFV